VLARLEHHAAEAVAEGLRLAEPPPDHRVRGRDAVLAGGVDNLAHEVGPAARLADQGRLALLDGGALGPGADQREARRHEKLAGPARGRRYLVDVDLAARVLE
jgi:hypothetical protein